MNLNSEAIMKNDVEIAINNVSVVFKDNQGNGVIPPYPFIHESV